MSEAEGLERFVEAQAPVYATALSELREGRKRTHWMWFIFPQLRGLGASADVLALRHRVERRKPPPISPTRFSARGFTNAPKR